MTYIPFTTEQKCRANSVDLVDFLQRQGETLVRSGREWRWQRHDSVTVRGNRWFRHSRKEGGLAIDFVQQFYDMRFPEAVSWLLGGEAGVEWNQMDKGASPERKAFELPEAHSDMRRVFAYLIKQRLLSREVVAHFAHEKLLYEDAAHHNAVFVGADETGVPRHAHKRGTLSKGKGYRGNVEGSDPRYSFHYLGSSDRLYVFESPIDLLSFLDLHPQHWQQHSYVSLDGIGEHAMLHQLSRHSHLQQVVLCLDHDPAGIEATGRLAELLREHSYCQVSVRLPEYKDWNECVKARHSVEALWPEAS
ncbi:DNA primase [compost metagenome]